MSVVNVEICCRIPSFSASSVVRSARICFKRREARLIDDPAAAAIESAAHLPSTARPGRDGLIRTCLPATTNRALTARSRHCASIGSTAFATRCGSSPTRKLSTPTRKRTSFASRCGVREPTSWSLNVRATGLATSVCASATAVSAAGVVSVGSTWVNAGESVRAPVRAAFASAATRMSASTASPGCDGMIENDPPRVTTWARRGFGSARESRLARASAPGRGTSTGSTSSTGGLGSTSCRTRRRNES